MPPRTRRRPAVSHERLESTALAPEPVTATDALPGSPEKIEELARRAARRESLHHERDVRTDPGRRLEFVAALGNHAQVKTGQTLPVRLDPGEKTPEPGETFGDRLRALREGKGWSLRLLARRSGVAHQTIHLLEEGTTASPTLHIAARLARALRVSLDSLADF